MWAHSDTNAYPSIILHDCFVSTINMEKDRLTFQFHDGYWITLQHQQNQYGKVIRTGPSEISYSEPDIAGLSVSLFEENQKRGQTIRKEIPFRDLCGRVNTGRWKLELVDEFYNVNGALFLGYISRKQKPYHIEYQMNMRYKAATYHWHEMLPNREW